MNPRYKITFYCKAAERDYKKLNPRSKQLVDYAFKKLEQRADSIGHPLSGSLSGCKKLKFKSDNLRIIYRITDDNKVEIVEIIVIGKRENNVVYRNASERL